MTGAVSPMIVTLTHVMDRMKFRRTTAIISWRFRVLRRMEQVALGAALIDISITMNLYLRVYGQRRLRICGNIRIRRPGTEKKSTRSLDMLPKISIVMRVV